MITTNIDRYGKYARTSAIADYLELVGFWHGRSQMRAAMADMLIDNSLQNS